jgi:hypothetical protein
MLRRIDIVSSPCTNGPPLAPPIETRLGLSTATRKTTTSSPSWASLAVAPVLHLLGDQSRRLGTRNRCQWLKVKAKFLPVAKGDRAELPNIELECAELYGV